MNIVEFYDKSAVDNIAGTLLLAPENVIFIGNNAKKMKKSLSVYEEIAEKRGLNVKFHYRTADRNDAEKTVGLLTEIINEFGECDFDLTGGEELFILSVGIVSGRFPDKVKLHRFNVRNGRLNDLDGDGKPVLTSAAEISVEENVRIYGGRIVYEAERYGATKKRALTAESVSDVCEMWKICKSAPGKWNFFVNVFSGICESSDETEPLTVSVKLDKLTAFDRGNKRAYAANALKELCEKGLLTKVGNNGAALTLRYKNEYVKDCLTKAGQLLELYVYYAAVSATENGGRVYNDVLTGVSIDWDGIPEGEDSVENEIDVFAMKGLIPVFISCKNGQVDTDELYKLHTVAHRFGGAYAKKVLVAPELDKHGSRAEHLRRRASEMNVRIVDDTDSLSFEEFCEKIKTFWI